MRKKVLKSFLLIVCFLQFSCGGIKIVEDRKSSENNLLVEDYSYDIRIPFFRYVPTPIDIAKICRGKDWKDVYVSGTILGGFVSVFTFGIVYPQKVQATCLN